MADRLGDSLKLGALTLGAHPLFVESGRAAPSGGGGSVGRVSRGSRVSVPSGLASFRPGSPLVPNRPNQIEK